MRPSSGCSGSDVTEQLLAWHELARGRFIMGTDEPTAPDDERPARQVSVGSLAITARPVSVAQWSRFVDATGYRTIAESEGSSFRCSVDPGEPHPGLDWRVGEAEAPVTHVAWFDAWEFCRWAGVRLPTEAEWAYAASNEAALHRELWQWCADWYDPTFHRTEQRVNPTGPVGGTHRVARGGSPRPTQRLGLLPDFSAADLGFRVVRDVRQKSLPG